MPRAEIAEEPAEIEIWPQCSLSALFGEDTEDSDLDLLVSPTEETTLMDIGAIRHELKELLGVEVDVLTPDALPDRHRDVILKEARLGRPANRLDDDPERLASL